MLLFIYLLKPCRQKKIVIYLKYTDGTKPEKKYRQDKKIYCFLDSPYFSARKPSAPVIPNRPTLTALTTLRSHLGESQFTYAAYPTSPRIPIFKRPTSPPSTPGRKTTSLVCL